jgi:hypothetical protein
MSQPTHGYGNAPAVAPAGKRGWWCRVPKCGAWGFVDTADQAKHAAHDHITREHTTRTRGPAS